MSLRRPGRDDLTGERLLTILAGFYDEFGKLRADVTVIAGATGATGASGSTGAAGTAGSSAAAPSVPPFLGDMFCCDEPPMIPGPSGRDGRDAMGMPPGMDGEDGLDGRDGIDGARGADGVIGRDGLPGFPGIDGEDGEDAMVIPGPQGPQGPAGGGGGSMTAATVTVSYGVQSATATVVDAAISGTSKIMLDWGTTAETDENTPAMCDVQFSAIPGSGQMTVEVAANNGNDTVGGAYKLNYMVA